MEISGISWLGTRTATDEAHAAMVAFARDVLGLAPTFAGPSMAQFALPDGACFEVFGPGQDDLPFRLGLVTGPVPAFEVADVDAARLEMEARGVEFLGPVDRLDDGWAWTYFRAPDGHVYEIAHNPNHRGPTAADGG